MTPKPSLATALAWIARHAQPLGPETVDAALARGRVLAQDVAAPRDWPPEDRAAWAGMAVSAHKSEGASDYAPMRVPGRRVEADMPLPSGTDAVVPAALAVVEAGQVIVLAPVAAGAGVMWRGVDVAAGSTPLRAGAVLDPAALGLLALMGVGRVPVLRQPRVALIAEGWLVPMLQALIEREGAVTELLPAGEGAHWARAGQFDAVLLTEPVAVLQAAGGELAWDGVAIEPGEGVGLGLLGNAPFIRLPVLPLACLAAFDLLAAPILRRLAGRSDPAPCAATLTRKISSVIGVTELVRVALAEGRATPRTGLGLGAAVGSEGYVLVPDRSEGYEPGATLSVYR